MNTITISADTVYNACVEYLVALDESRAHAKNELISKEMAKGAGMFFNKHRNSKEATIEVLSGSIDWDLTQVTGEYWKSKIENLADMAAVAIKAGIPVVIDDETTSVLRKYLKVG